MKQLSFLLVIFYALTSTTCFTQNTTDNQLISERSTLNFDYFNVQSGLSNNYITDLAQDSLGYIWVSTFDGLNRYNGTNFLNFKKDADSPNTLNYNFIQQTKFNHQGNLFIATGEGLNIYDPKTESFSLIDEKNGLIRESLSCMEFGINGELILAIYGSGIQFFTPDTPEKKQILSHNPNNINSISSNHVSSLLLEPNTDNLWVGTFNDGLNLVNYKTKDIKRIALGDEKDLGIKQINCMIFDKSGNLWIGTKNGIIIYSKENEILHILKGDDESNGLSDNEILSLEIDYLGNIWIGTQNGGLNIMSLAAYKANDKYIKWYLPNHNGNEFLGRRISTIMEDKDHNMWIGTNYGLYLVNPKDHPIEHYKKKHTDNPVTITSNNIRSITEHYTGEIWIGTDGAGLNLYNPLTGKFKYYTHDKNNPKSLSNNYIYSVLEDRKKRVWVGTYRGGLNLLDPDTGFTKKYLQGSVDNGYKVNLVYEDYSGKIWVGTNRGGLYYYQENKDSFHYVEPIGKKDIRDITEDGFGNLYMATYGDGVIKFNPESNSYEVFKMDNTPGITSNIIFAIRQLEDKNFLVGSSYGGLYKLYPNSRKAKSYTEKVGLSNNTITSMVANNEKEIWIGTFNGLNCYNSTTETIKNLNSFDNISGIDFNVGAAYKAKSGLLYFGSNNGFYSINPNKIFNSEIKTPLIFENITVFNDKIKVSTKNQKGLLNKSLPYLKHVTLNHNQTLIKIDFSILKYPSAQKVKYAYKLEGYQDQWVNLNTNHSINLSKLPPGDYNLVVKGFINPEKTVSNNLFLTIKPPFWKTIPAYILYLIIITTLIWLAIKYYTERLKLKSSLQLEKKQRQLENELNLERVRFFTSFSHELKTPLSLIIAPIEELIEKIDKKQQKEQLNIVLKNSKLLLKNIQKLLEFRKSEMGLNTISIVKSNISEHIEQTLISYKTVAKSRSIHLKFERPKEDIIIWCDIEKLEIIFHNLLSNAFKYSKRNDIITITLTSENNKILISVKDQGKGISKEDLPHIFDWYYQSSNKSNKAGTGIGLALSKRFAELHFGNIYVESNLNQGTTFTLSIPKDAFQGKTEDASSEQVMAIKDTDQDKISEIWEHDDHFNETPSIKSKIREDQKRNLVLIVDDNKDILKFLSQLLEEEYDLIFAENGEIGVKKAIKYVPDLIISYIMMPLSNGLELCKFIRTEQTTSHIPFILLTAVANTDGINEGYLNGADDYITKPFHPKLLKSRISNQLTSIKT